MKKLLFLVLILVSTISMSQNFTYNGINYTITDAVTFKVAVATHTSFNGAANIPATVVYNSQNYDVSSIGSTAFFNCSGLTSITIPNSVTSIGFSALRGCPGLTSIIIPNSVTSIGQQAFESSSNLTSIVFPSSVTSIGPHAFTLCTNLASVTLPNSITSIGQYAFQSCESLTSVIIPNSLTTIEHGTFSNCINLTSVTIPNTITSFGMYAFYRCTSLPSVTIPNSVTSIGLEAFRLCTSLTSITLPNSLTSIGSDSFRSCTALTSVTIPNSLTSIGFRSFQDCTSLTTVNCAISIPLAILDNVFLNVNQSACALNVPIGSETAYEAAPVWTNFNPINGVLASDSFILNNFSIYPNPTSEILNITLENNLTLEKVNIYNTLGQFIKSEKSKTIDVKSLAKGNYFVEVITNQGKATKTIIVE
ncbi:leucine-rich repeat domain-containing protein [Flavobacterium terrigena]|uniref:Por secretion system C-terminal sorting domain-containing protein n=1 Tax=Flavobacterium terrigena TaxID=402734 RepID=A0A1H6TRK0_9FLAO|nr:leucine-rich repeat domain-containing protein [Flavobacterium terrigena]SEI78362.1 Por secretion system C-terminal sorting domain-containing protein [Flavobacterium terrigena]